MSFTPGAAATASRIRVLVCEDDALVRGVLAAYLKLAADVVLIAAVGDTATAQEVLTDQDVDVVLIDVRTPGAAGRETAAWIAGRAHAPRVLYLASFDDECLGRDAVTGLVAGVLTRDISPTVLIQAIRAAHGGLTVLAPSAVGALRSGILPGPAHDPLTDRQHEVMSRVCDGLSNAEIARELYVSESTVKQVITTLMTRFEVGGRVTLALRVVRAGLI